MGPLTNRFTSAIWADPDVIPYALRVAVWGRWFICFLSAFELAYRPSFWCHNDMGYLLQLVSVVTLNDLVHFRLLTNVVRRFCRLGVFVTPACPDCPAVLPQ